MSNWLPHYDFEDASSGEQASNASMTNQQIEHEQMHFDDTQSPQHWNLHSDYNIWSHPKCNESFDDSDNWKQFNEDFNISTSLKPNIWSNSTHNIPINHENNYSSSTERKNIARTSLSEPVIGTSKQTVNKLGNEWDSVNSTANSGIANSNSIKRRPITSGNGIPYSNSIQPAYGMENKFTGVSSSLPYQADPILMKHLAEESCEKFMQKLQVIVKNDFLNPKILTEPISPDTYELINMLVYYVMEYGRTKRYVQPDVPNTALDADISIIFYKINLIRNEIAKCQSKFIETKRIEQATLQSFAERNNVATRPQTLNDQRNLRHVELPMIRDLNNRYSNYTTDAESIRPNQCSNLTLSNEAQYHRRLNQSTNQCQVEQTQQQNAVQSVPTHFQFLPKAKNCENRFYLNNNNDASQQNDRSMRKESTI